MFTASSAFKIREHGIQSRENLKIYAKRPQCTASGSSYGSVRFTECSPVVLLLAYGFAASSILLIIELLLNRYSKRNIVQQPMDSNATLFE